MTAPFLTFDSVRRCESEIWRSLAGIMQMTLEHWTGSETVRRALERVFAVMNEQVNGTSCDRRGGRKWTH